MRNILVIGAGRSSSSLITYLLNKSTSENLHITVADVSIDFAKDKIQGHIGQNFYVNGKVLFNYIKILSKKNSLSGDLENIKIFQNRNTTLGTFTLIHSILV